MGVFRRRLRICDKYPTLTSWYMSHDKWFPTMWYFAKCRLRRACVASLILSLETPKDVQSVAQHSQSIQVPSKGSDLRLRVCAGWSETSEAVLAAHSTLLEIPCRPHIFLLPGHVCCSVDRIQNNNRNKKQDIFSMWHNDMFGVELKFNMTINNILVMATDDFMGRLPNPIGWFRLFIDVLSI